MKRITQYIFLLIIVACGQNYPLKKVELYNVSARPASSYQVNSEKVFQKSDLGTSNEKPISANQWNTISELSKFSQISSLKRFGGGASSYYYLVFEFKGRTNNIGYSIETRYLDRAPLIRTLIEAIISTGVQ